MIGERGKSKHDLWIVWGGQFGSEGKGEVVAHLTKQHNIQTGVRVGGPNAGHTYHLDGKVVVQSVPIVAMRGGQGIIGPAGMFLLDILKRELEEGYNLLGRPVKLAIDLNTAIITSSHMASEAHLKATIGSTGEGVGAATAEKVMREPTLVVGANMPMMRAVFGNPIYGGVTFENTSRTLNSAASNDLLPGDVLLEGTQGYGLSLHTGGFYPKCTSRECTPYALIAETGINPDLFNKVNSVMVVRTHPIRVGGNSGPLENEITWEQLEEESGGYISVPEITTVTKKVRRIGRLDLGLIGRAALQCSPTAVAVTFLDYQFPELAACTDKSILENRHLHYLNHIQQVASAPVCWAGTGPGMFIDFGPRGV
jgi:adenylosuccinate synthase